MQNRSRIRTTKRFKPVSLLCLGFQGEFGSREGGFGLHLLQSTVGDVVGQFEEVRKVGGQDRLQVLLLNWVEHTVAKAVGAKYTPQFLHDFSAC